jgi:cobalt-zinc-cadmium efflux system membrane fusion protein
MTRIALLGLLLALSSACRDTTPPTEATEAHEHDDHAEKTGHVDVTPEQRTRFDITTATAGPGDIDLGIDLPGEVRPDGNRFAHIVPRFPGIVREVRVDVGDAVKSGDVLAVIESNESLAPYQLTTLLAGTVIQRHLTRGEAVDREKQAFIIADLSTVWVDASVFQKDLSHVRVGHAVRVFTSDGGPSATGTIAYVTPTVDAPTRTATARVVLTNSDGRWRPGMFVTVRVLDPVRAPVVVQRSAVQTIDGQTVVFVETDDGFVVRPVTLGRSGATQSEVLSGLSGGDRYAATNTFLLKAEAGKGAASQDH